MYPHENNINGKLKKLRESDPKNHLPLLLEIESEYTKYRQGLSAATGDDKESVTRKAELLNSYMNFIYNDKFSVFSSQGKLHSTVLEEFCIFLFEPIINYQNYGYKLGPSKAYTNLFFSPRGFKEFATSCSVTVSEKDQDFCISKVIECSFTPDSESGEVYTEMKTIVVPVLSIECKTYLDKTMFDSAAHAAAKVKAGNPYCLNLILSETNAIKEGTDLITSGIDQIYILRKCNQTEIKNGNRDQYPFSPELIWEIYEHVKMHLTNNWFDPEGARNGKLINK